VPAKGNAKINIALNSTAQPVSFEIIPANRPDCGAPPKSETGYCSLYEFYYNVHYPMPATSYWSNTLQTNKWSYQAKGHLGFTTILLDTTMTH